MNDKIILTDLDYLCNIGVTEAERSTPQQLLVDAEISLDIKRAAETQAVEDSVCWERLQKVFEGIIAGEKWILVEALIERLGEAVFANFPAATGVKLRVKKFCLPNAGWVGVEIDREREALNKKISSFTP